MIRRLLAACLFSIALTTVAGAQEPAAQPPPAQPSAPEPQDQFVPVDELPPHEQLPAAPLLVAAYAFAWLAIGGYVVSVARRLNTVQQEIERLEADVKRVR